jgi:hypothetical protein
MNTFFYVYAIINKHFFVLFQVRNHIKKETIFGQDMALK